MIELRPLFVMKLDVKPSFIVGATPGPFRRIGVVPSGTFEGERLSGVVLDGSSDWQTVRADGAITLDVRLLLRTHDGVALTLAYHGLRHGPADVLARLDRGDPVDPSEYYFRISGSFEAATTSSYDWLNRIVMVGTGYRLPGGPVYTLYEVA
ncbi:MAG: DUF3237 domain-containing protein [Kofleriaceae bacterium]